MSERVLEGVKVLDFTVALAGPYSTLMMAAMGADVIKIENPKTPPLEFANRPGATGGDNVDGIGYFFSNVNADKKAITLNMKSEECQEIFRKMVAEADVLVENNRPGVLAKFGFDYESCAKINPRLIYASGSGFGQSGLYWKFPGYDIVGQAMGGAMSITGFPGDAPTNAGPSFSDCSVSVNLCAAVIAALLNREETGKGSHIDTSLVDGVVTDQRYQLAHALFGEGLKQTGNRVDRIGGPRDGYYAADGYFVIECTTQAEFEALCSAMGMDGLASDPRFATPQARQASANADDPLKEIISGWAADKTVADIMQTLQGADVPAFPVYNYKDIYESEHFHDARQMFVPVEMENGNEMIVTGMPIKMSTYDTSLRKCIPYLGSDNEEIFEGLGYTREQLDEFRSRGVIAEEEVVSHE